MVAGRYIITPDIMGKLIKRDKKPGRKKIKKNIEFS
jgi:hypothetical protein